MLAERLWRGPGGFLVSACEVFGGLFDLGVRVRGPRGIRLFVGVEFERGFDFAGVCMSFRWA